MSGEARRGDDSAILFFATTNNHHHHTQPSINGLPKEDSGPRNIDVVLHPALQERQLAEREETGLHGLSVESEKRVELDESENDLKKQLLMDESQKRNTRQDDIAEAQNKLNESRNTLRER